MMMGSPRGDDGGRFLPSAGSSSSSPPFLVEVLAVGEDDTMLLLRTRRTKKERSLSGLRCHESSCTPKSKDLLLLLPEGCQPLKASVICSKKASLSSVRNTMGRERLMCKGRGLPKSEVRKEVMEFAVSDDDDDDNDNNPPSSSLLKEDLVDRKSSKRPVNSACCWAVGCHST